MAAHDHAQHAEQSNLPFQFFSANEAVEIDAMAAQIIPSDDAPGAREAHVIHFIDRALVTFDRDKQPIYMQGLKDLQHRTREVFPTANQFSSLIPAEQIQILASIEKTEFFELVRVHTIIGFLAKPEYGGNNNQEGWKLIGFEDQMIYAPPFGYYDSEYDKGQRIPKS